MELDPLYYDVMVQRSGQFAGKNAERASGSEHHREFVRA